MYKIKSNIIANEFDLSPNLINTRVENHMNKTDSDLDAKIKAEISEKTIKLIKEEENRKKSEREQKIKDNLKNYQQKKKIEEDNKIKEKIEKEAIRKKKLEYNDKIRQSHVKKETKGNVSIINTSKQIKSNDISERNVESFIVKELVEGDKPKTNIPLPIETKSFQTLENSINEENSQIETKNEIPSNIKQVIEQTILQEGSRTNNSANKLMNFRKTGKIKNKEQEEEEETMRKYMNEYMAQTNTLNKIKDEEMKFRNELERRRYIKALKNLMIEKFSEKKINIPSICSCGQLQKKLDVILESKNFTVTSAMNFDCANNCIYYNNSIDYKKAISDVIKSIKALKLENFSN